MSNSALALSEGIESYGTDDITVVFSPFSSEKLGEAMLMDELCCGINCVEGWP